MKSSLHISLLIGAVLVVGLLADAWRSARRDTDQLNSKLASQNALIEQATAREKQRDVQLDAALAEIAAQKRAVKTPQQAAQAIPSVLPPLPLPVSVHIPDLSRPLKPGEISPDATISIPQLDLKPLYDNLQDCRANAIEMDITKTNLADEQARADFLMKERDAAIATAHGGTFWVRIKRGAKWFAIGVAAGAAAIAVARH